MEIQSVKEKNCVYTNTLSHYKVITTDSIVMDVPLSESNTTYQVILAWVKEGNTIEPADE